jgi:hypothetical protein
MGTRLITCATAVFGLLLFTQIPLLADSKDSFVGRWVLDPDHSQFTPGPGPLDRTMTFEIKNGSLHRLTDTKSANDANTIERIGMVKHMPAENCMMKVSPDGKTLTMTVKGDYSGIHYSSMQVYKRQ